MYLALFVFTMTGCVQIFVIKTNNAVGDGVEFYTGENEVAPHVTRFNINKETVDPSTVDLVKNPNSGSNHLTPATEIYSLQVDAKTPV